MPSKSQLIYDTNMKSIYQSRDILKTLDRISDNESKSICIIPFGSREEIFDVLPEKQHAHHSIKVVRQKQQIAQYTLKTFQRKDNQLKFQRDFFLYKVPGYKYGYLIISLGNPDFCIKSSGHSLNTIITK